MVRDTRSLNRSRGAVISGFNDVYLSAFDKPEKMMTYCGVKNFW